MQITCILYSLEEMKKIDNAWKALFYRIYSICSELSLINTDLSKRLKTQMTIDRGGGLVGERKALA